MIKEQVKLPFKIAYDITVQGIRIRLGRSFVTLFGVALGIAFLMSIFCGILIKRGVSSEEELRLNVKRMINILSAETGDPKGKVFGMIQAGPLDETEQRLLSELKNKNVESIKRFSTSDSLKVPITVSNIIETVSINSIGKGASAILVLGDINSLSVDWNAVLSSSRQQVVAFSRSREGSTDKLPPEVSIVELGQKLRPEEIEKKRLTAMQGKFRNIWILTISLLVTVIGISNSMLMSVTERFREIGTMKCLGALSAFIRKLFLIESSIMGLIGSISGSVFGIAFSIIAYGFTYSFNLVMTSMNWVTLLLYFVLCVAIGLVLSIVAAIYPASFASRMIPATALRSNV